jgi:peptidoglycan/xylan/chitin deacetylase (PgdA/CDA1 family)
VLQRRASVLSLQEAINALDAGRLPPRAAVLTFDDGYGDTVDRVLPLLERNGVPATVFVTPGTPGEAFWWDELAGMLLQQPVSPTLELELRGRKQLWSLSDQGASSVNQVRSRRHALSAVAAELRGLSVAERDEQMSRIRAWSGRPEARVAAAHRGLTVEEIRHLAKSRQIEIGAHTMSHPVLPSLPESAQLREIEESRSCLEWITGKAVTLFSYPHGSYTASTMAAVRNSGFVAACCSMRDVASARSNRLALPRLWVADLDGPRFDTWLRHWLVN